MLIHLEILKLLNKDEGGSIVADPEPDHEAAWQREDIKKQAFIR